MRSFINEDVVIAIVDRTNQKRLLLDTVAAALQFQAQVHFAAASPKGWGLSARVRVATERRPLLPEEWPLYLLPESEIDVEDAFGYHDESKNGVPFMKIFPGLDEKEGQPWSITASHEILETLADPWLGRCIQNDQGRIWSLEVCDPVELDHYLISTVSVSNFVLPSWFEPPKDKSTVRKIKYDYLGLCKNPFEIREGGYAQYLTKDGWRSINAEKVRPYRARKDLRGRSNKRSKKVENEPIQA